MTAANPRIVELALQLGQQPALGMDIGSTVQGVCAALPSLVGVTAAVVMLSELPDIAPAAVFASDQPAEWMGEVQRRAQRGPLPDAITTGRPMTTPDLTRIGPPEVAAAAAECGLTSSVVMPLQSGDHRVGALQLLGAAGLPVTGEHGDSVRAVASTLAARLVDVYALRRAGAVRPAAPPVPRQAHPPQHSQPLAAPKPPAASPKPVAPKSLAASPKPVASPKAVASPKPGVAPQPAMSQPLAVLKPPALRVPAQQSQSQPLPVPPPKRHRSGRTGPTPSVASDEVVTAAITAVPAELPFPRKPLPGSRHAKPADGPEPPVAAEGRRSGRRRAANGHAADEPRPRRRNGSAHAR